MIESSVRRVLASRDADARGDRDRRRLERRHQRASSPRPSPASRGCSCSPWPNGGKARRSTAGLDAGAAARSSSRSTPTPSSSPRRSPGSRAGSPIPTIGAVAGNAKVGNRVNLVTRWQAIEYVTAQNLERRALAGLGAIMVVPGAVGAWRRAALDEVGGFPVDTLAEDQDLTIAIQRAGWRVANDHRRRRLDRGAAEACARLAKQRFRWSFGTLQCLWKHRAVAARGPAARPRLDRHAAGLAVPDPVRPGLADDRPRPGRSASS